MKKKIYFIFLISIVILFFVAIFVNCIIFPKKYKNLVLVNCDKYNLEIALVYAVIKQESDFNKNAVSSSGALGLMQILPSTAKWIAGELGVEYSKENLFEPKVNIEFGCFYLRYLFDKFNDIETVVCAYNAGETKVLDWIENGRISRDLISYPETLNYLNKVMGYYKVYKNKLFCL